MAEIVQEKSRGLKFAEQQLLRHGWEQGKGLGRDENGISEAIKVKVKCDKGGVGHKQGEQFTFHWWDHVFNKASASLQVESDQNGVLVKKTVEEEDNGAITNRKPRKAALDKAKLYGCFVKSATLLSGQEQPEPKPSSSDDSSSSEDEDQRLDLSSTTKLSDAELIKACGGRTAHKGARHGLTMNAKLARLEQQEAEFMAKYGKKSQSGSTSPECATPSVQSAAQSPEREEEVTEMEFQKKKSKKTKKKKSPVPCHENVTAVSESQETDAPLKKKKKKRKGNCEEASEEVTVTASTEEELNPLGNTEADHLLGAKTRRKKKKKNREESEAMTSDLTQEGESTGVTRGEGEEQEASLEPQTDMDAKAKKKKKKKKKSSERGEEERPVPPAVDQGHATESDQSGPLLDSPPKNKRKAEGGEGGEEEDATAKRKKKKHSEVVAIQMDVVNGEAAAPQKKKKKTTKEQTIELD